jgi:hypothetical protein
MFGEEDLPMRKLVSILAVTAVGLTAVGCRSGDQAAPVTYGYERKGWDAAAQAQGKALAAKVAASKVTCGAFADDPWASFLPVYQQKKMPMPLGSGTCVSDAAQENITFEVFPDQATRQAFVDAKATLLCARGIALGSGAAAPFPGLPYVDGDLWIAEPDSVGMADELAPILGGKAANMCKDLPATGPAPSILSPGSTAPTTTKP